MKTNNFSKNINVWLLKHNSCNYNKIPQELKFSNLSHVFLRWKYKIQINTRPEDDSFVGCSAV
jgi:hypothetical protein